MRILFINTTDIKGGAAIVACRLMEGLERFHDTENYFLVRYKKGKQERTIPTVNNRIQKAIERSLTILTNSVGMQYLFYPFSSKNILTWAKRVRPDIISLHNSHGGYFATPLLEKLSAIAPIAWTMHDMWSFSGNAAHSFGDTSWRQLKNTKALTRIYPSIGINTGSFLLKLKKKVYNRSNITLIAPSQWLKDLACQSPLFEGKNIIQIYNGVDSGVFRQMDKKECRLKLGLPPEEKIIMFGAESIRRKNPWKGGQQLFDILGIMNNKLREKIHLLVLGEGDVREFDSLDRFIVHHKGYVSSEEEMVCCLNAADLFVYPTKADNLPNVLIEAISCGTPCVTFDIGGNQEIIINDFNGYIIPPFDLEEFANKTIDLMKDESKIKVFSANAAGMAGKKFSLEEMSDKYFTAFSQIKDRGYV